MPGQPGVSPKQRRGRDTVERLLRSALEVYADTGTQGFTMTAVIEASGVSVGSLYHHFGSFEGLAATLYLRCKDDLLNTLIQAVRTTRTARTGVYAMVSAYLRWSAEHPTEALIIHASPYAGYLRAQADRLREDKAPKLQELLELFAPHVAAGRIQSLPPALTEMLVIGPVSVAVSRWLAGVPGFDLDEAARLLPERVWQSVRGPNA
ncbi:TetR/AcrR family transcriptional regulator [Streptomyces litchfieldiae]|uniref:TetR/AcrR family transcriptional regulator n=1 Tax=Streptomyces litchfieldiae TaxID=3075543 RepID=A0ABU2MK32_9ACTN|nr:TetR/AcrR family transcriptional regulator [Streptomyces sp. DSM 44938]MDT0341966.1 TetR/AcrR family transcriptional regulator [Streptomyces sp. DSM 44938]